MKNKSVLLLLVFAITPIIVKVFTLLLGFTGYGLQSVYKLFQFGIPLLWWHFATTEYTTAQKLLWKKPTLISVCVAACIGVTLGIIGIIAARFAIPLLHIDPVAIRTSLDARFSMTPITALLVVIFLASLNAALEEFYFRGWMDIELSSRTSNTIGVIVSTLLFGVIHIFIFVGTPGLTLTIYILVCIALTGAGAIWSLLLRKTRTLYTAIISHGLTDAMLLGWGLRWLGYW